MQKNLFSILTILLFSVSMSAQSSAPEQRPQRTPEEEALKQTVRLTRELGIKDSIRIDTIYRMHLKYARFRQKGLTRAENMERMQAIYKELERLLTPEEFTRFMNHPAEQPRLPRGANVLTPTRQVQRTEPQSSNQQ
jgi:hypothetical protein